ncbi:N-ATPase subunit AtpR [Burkholderia aenigmatica]|uniref:N-ATPase subunit AtpR n=1 Tax=Burkholderia aenigmatica TaxID=2015348 RepID=UPI00264F3092|nr:ATP synthase subunit I [Burkholderia aenigmatica]MDN7874965.1 ATP synthase subunit I [Burkholderia aenigmatica]
MISIQTLSLPLQTAVGGITGGIVGLAYFPSLLANVRWYARDAIGIAVIVHLVRFGTLALVLFGLAQVGYGALLSGLAGIMLARRAMIRLPGGSS